MLPMLPTAVPTLGPCTTFGPFFKWLNKVLKSYKTKLDLSIDHYMGVLAICVKKVPLLVWPSAFTGTCPTRTFSLMLGQFPCFLFVATWTLSFCSYVLHSKVALLSPHTSFLCSHWWCVVTTYIFLFTPGFVFLDGMFAIISYAFGLFSMLIWYEHCSSSFPFALALIFSQYCECCWFICVAPTVTQLQCRHTFPSLSSCLCHTVILSIFMFVPFECSMDSFEFCCLLCPAFFSQWCECHHFPVSIPHNPLAFSLQVAELLAL